MRKLQIFDTLHFHPIDAIYSRNSRWLLKSSQNATNIFGSEAQPDVDNIGKFPGWSQTHVHYVAKIPNQFFFVTKMSKCQYFLIKNLFYFPI